MCACQPGNRTFFGGHAAVEGVTMCMSSEFVYEFSKNKGQFERIRYKNGKFCSILPDCPNSIPYSTF